MTMYGEWDIAPHILNLGTTRMWVTDLLPGIEPPPLPQSAHWIGGWVGLTAGLDTVTKRNTPAFAGNRIPVIQPII
jgi:hypothetical protein